MSKDQSVLDEFMPDDRLMAIAWIGALRYALGNEEMIAAFRAETGNNWTPAKTGFGQVVDAATGAEADFLRQFAVWFNENVWGDPEEKENA